MDVARIFRESDCDPALIKGRCVAMLGFGAQGKAQALNLRDSGVQVIVGLKPESKSVAQALDFGFEVRATAEAVALGTVIVMNVPDGKMAKIYLDEVAPYLNEGSAVVFSHGFNVHYRLIEFGTGLDVILVAPKGQGDGVRKEFLEGKGMPALIGVHADASGRALPLALSYAWAIGSARAMVVESSFSEETEADLFSEQAVLCGGLKELVKMGFETLIEAGYAPEAAYFECLHELKLIVDLLVEGGVAGMLDRISDTAEWGAYVGGPQVIGPEARAGMRAILDDVRNGSFARSMLDQGTELEPHLNELRTKERGHPIEQVGAQLRKTLKG